MGLKFTLPCARRSGQVRAGQSAPIPAPVYLRDVPRPCQNERNTGVATGRERATRTVSELDMRRLTRCVKHTSKPWISLVGCPFRAENRGWPLSADADDCLTA